MRVSFCKQCVACNGWKLQKSHISEEVFILLVMNLMEVLQVDELEKGQLRLGPCGTHAISSFMREFKVNLNL